MFTDNVNTQVDADEVGSNLKANDSFDLSKQTKLSDLKTSKFGVQALMLRKSKRSPKKLKEK